MDVHERLAAVSETLEEIASIFSKAALHYGRSHPMAGLCNGVAGKVAHLKRLIDVEHGNAKCPDDYESAETS